MAEFGVIKDDEAKKLAKTDLGLIPPERRRTTGQYFLDYVQQTLEAKYGPDMVFKGGLNVYTTLNPTMQLAAEQSLRDGLKALRVGPAQARPGEHPEGAMVTVEPQTGYVKAMVGGYDFFRSEFNRAVQAKRQPGSAFKPFIYIAALEAGFTPASQIEDSPVSYAVGPNGQSVEARELRPQVPRLHDPPAGDRGVGQRRDRQAPGAGRRCAKTIQVARRFGIASPLDHQPEPGARHVGPLAAGADLGLRRARQPGRLDAAGDDSLRDRCAGQAPRGARARRAARRCRPRPPT